MRQATLAEWLGSRPDAELAELLRLRPDLTVPLPASMAVLANRADQRASVARAADEFDMATLVVLDTMITELDEIAVVTRAQVHKLLMERAGYTAAAVDSAIDRLLANGIVWGEPELRVSAGASAALPWPVGGSRPEEDALTPDQIAAALDSVGEAERTLLDRLAYTSPIGRTRDAAPDTPADRPVQRLLTAKLLRWIDEQTVELPSAVGRYLRSEQPDDPHSLTPPPVQPVQSRHAGDTDRVAAGEALELLRHCTDIVTALGHVPAPALRAGGLGVRELRRVAKQTGIDEDRIGLLVEVLVAAGLIARGMPENYSVGDVDEFWAPTSAVDAWLEADSEHRWVVLASTWLSMSSRPWMIGMRDSNDKPIAALSNELRSIQAAPDRRAILEPLAALGPGQAATPSELVAAAIWRRPRWAGRFRGGSVDRTLAEATTLGVVGHGALSAPGRALLTEGQAAAEAAMAQALPAPVDYVLVQADLTVVAPGPLVPELRHRIALVADLESAGGAGVYRVREDTVRRALDAGTTVAELHSLFATHSRTPVPQALTYLIDDVARRHGKLRVGMAASFLRCDDPAQLAEVLASPVAEQLALRAVAPTVAISQAPLAEVLDKLRSAGFAPAGEDSRGAIVDLRARGARILGRRPRQQVRMPSAPTTEQLETLIVQLRANDRATRAKSEAGVRGDGSHTGGAAIMSLLQLAVRVHRQVRLSYVDASGVASMRIVEPARVGGGQLDAVDPATGAMRHYSLHRIAAVGLVE